MFCQWMFSVVVLLYANSSDGYLSEDSPQYVGCTQMDGLLMVVVSNYTYTLEICVKLCRLYTFAGVQGTQCLCGVDPFTRNPFNSLCHRNDNMIRCRSNPYQKCGAGGTRYTIASVYRTCPSGYRGENCDVPCPDECPINQTIVAHVWIYVWLGTWGILVIIAVHKEDGDLVVLTHVLIIVTTLTAIR